MQTMSDLPLFPLMPMPMPVPMSSSSHSPLGALRQALRLASLAAWQASPPQRGVLMVGGGGPLGSAVLEHLLGSGHWARVAVLVSQPLEVAVKGLVAWPAAWLDAPPALAQANAATAPTTATATASSAAPDTAVLVFDSERSRHRREAALYRPLPDTLPQVARGLLALGVRRLVVVLPHAPGLLPQALRAGLASLDEQAVAALGIAQLVLVRPARLPGGGQAAPLAGFWPRVAGAVLSQMQLMVPQRQQPLRAARVAQFVADLALALPAAGPGTRVVAPALRWDWAQPGGGAALLQAWLAGPGAACPAPQGAAPIIRG